MNFFDGLYLYEIVLLVLGVLFFLVLLFVLVYSIMTKQAIKGFIFIFLIPIIMIGYPSIQKIKIGNIEIEIARLTHAVEQNPTDTKARAALIERLSEIERRPISSPSSLIKLAKAHAVIGNRTKADTYIDSVLKVKPYSKEAIILRKSLETPPVEVER